VGAIGGKAGRSGKLKRRGHHLARERVKEVTPKKKGTAEIQIGNEDERWPFIEVNQSSLVSKWVKRGPEKTLYHGISSMERGGSGSKRRNVGPYKARHRGVFNREGGGQFFKKEGHGSGEKRDLDEGAGKRKSGKVVCHRPGVKTVNLLQCGGYAQGEIRCRLRTTLLKVGSMGVRFDTSQHDGGEKKEAGTKAPKECKKRYRKKE